MYPILEKTVFQVWFSDDMPPIEYIPEDYLLVYVLTGNVLATVAGHSFELPQGSFFLVEPDEAYMIRSDSSFFLCTVRMDFHFIVRCCDYQRPKFFDTPDSRVFSNFKDNACLSQLIDKIDSLADIFFKEPRLSPARMTYYFYDFAYYFIENFKLPDTAPPAGQYINSRIYTIAYYIENNYNLPVTLNSLASEIGLTPQYLSSFIRKNMGTTFNTLLYDTRFKYVLSDLSETNQDITHIALNNGFPNVSGFNRMFKSRYHMTPTDYRKIHQTNTDTAHIPYTHLAKRARELYKSYVSIRTQQKSNRHIQQFIIADTAKSHQLYNPWNQMINIGQASCCLQYHHMLLIQKMTRQIPFQYARIHQFLCQEFFEPVQNPYPKDSRIRTKHYSCAQADMLIDQLKTLGLIPVIVLEFDHKDTIDPEHLIKLLGKYLPHSIARYGAAYISRWKFEIVKPVSWDNAAYCQIFKEISGLIHRFSPQTACGGPLYALEHPLEDFIQLLTQMQTLDITPHFITIALYPYSQAKVISLNQNINRQRMEMLNRQLAVFRKSAKFSTPNTLPVYITDFGFTRTFSPINDTVFMATYLLHNSIMIKDYANLICWPALIDLPSEDSRQLLTGGHGLFTWSSLGKPVLYALHFLTQLGEQILYCGKSAIAAMNKDRELQIILFNYKHPDAYYCHEENHSLDIRQAVTLFESEVEIAFEITLHNLDAARYQMVCYELNTRHGSILDRLLETDGIISLHQEVIDHLKKTVVPDLTVSALTCTRELKTHKKLPLNTILLIKLLPSN